MFDRQEEEMGMLTLCSIICERPFYCQGGSNLVSAGSERVSIGSLHKTQHDKPVQEYAALDVLY